MKRPYFFEIIIVLNFLLIQLLLWRITRAPLATMARVLAMLIPVFVIQALIGIAIRIAVAGHQRREYVDAVRSTEWIVDTARIVVFSALSVHTYGWIKISIPLIHPRLFDRELWNLDQAMFFGHSPDIFLLDLFSNRMVLRFFDWTYANVFILSINVASIFFLSAASRRLRIAFTNSNTLMWLVGAWLYVLTPSLGPAYRFPQVWLPLSATLANTQELQRILMTNYQMVLRFARGVNQPVNILYGIAAFPSLHVAFEVLVYLWVRRVWRLGAVLFVVFTGIIFLGSVVTGWHYLIDSIAGVVLAMICYAVVAIRQRKQAFSVACLN